MNSTEVSLLRLGERVACGNNKNGTVISVKGYAGLVIRWDHGTLTSSSHYDAACITAVVYKPRRYSTIARILDSTSDF